MDYRQKALDVLEATNIFDEKDITTIMQVASEDAIQEMELFCARPDLLGWMKNAHLSKGLKEYERKFLTGFFGKYETDNSITNPRDIFWNQHKRARAYVVFGGYKPFNFFKQNCRATPAA